MTASLERDFEERLGIHLDAQTMANETKRQYITALRNFASWLEDEGRPPQRKLLAGVTRDDIERYVATRERRRGSGPLSDSTKRWHFAGLQAVCVWASAREKLPNPMLGMKGPKPATPPKDVVTKEQMISAIAALDRQNRWRDAALVDMLCEAGARISECLNLNWADINWKRREMVLRLTKNGHPRDVPLFPKLLGRLDALNSGRDDEDPAVFLGVRGKRLSIFVAHRIVKGAFEQVGIEGIGPHDLRHSWCTAFMNANPGDEATIMIVGGWETPTMVRHYARHGKEERASQQFKQASALASL